MGSTRWTPAELQAFLAHTRDDRWYPSVAGLGGHWDAPV